MAGIGAAKALGLDFNCSNDFISKGMMNDGVRPVSVTIFIVKKYSVIYRLQT